MVLFVVFLQKNTGICCIAAAGVGKLTVIRAPFPV
jgi:hypothetical protein